MTDETHTALPSTGHMVAYDENSSVQDRMIIARQGVLKRQVRAIGPQDGDFTIADFGCGPGRSALDAVRPSIDAYRALTPDGPVVVRHCDQPENDWNGLMALVHGAGGYMHDAHNVRVEMGVGSFYTAMAPTASVHLATCFAASHWSSRALYLHSPGALFYSDLTGAALDAMRALGREDWTTFLRCRAQELAPGGHLVTSTLGTLPDAGEPSGLFGSGRKLYRAMQCVAQSMVDDGLVSQEALDTFIFPLWFPGADDFEAPLKEHDDLAAAFEPVSLDVSPIPDDWHDVFAHERANPARYAALYAGYTKGFADSTLRLHLFGRSAQSEAEVDALIAEFFARFRDLYEAEPGEHASETVIATQILRRTAA